MADATRRRPKQWPKGGVDAPTRKNDTAIILGQDRPATVEEIKALVREINPEFTAKHYG